MTDQGKNNTRIVLAALAIVSLFITAVLVPMVKSGTSADQQAAILQRLARLEECTRKIEPLPERVWALIEAVNGLKENSARMEKKIDDHVTKEK